MQLTHGLHLAYCTNIHRGETWEQTFGTLKQFTLGVRDRVAKGKPYAIGLRLGNQASLELSEPARLTEFRKWLDAENCYVFTINGFPYGSFHGTRVKEQVYAPDWTADERVVYTNRLFDLLAQIVPEGVEGSVSTVPCSFKEFITNESQVAAMRRNLWRTVEHIAKVSERTGKKLHLGLEPEPLCYLETSEEMVQFYNQMRDERPQDARLGEHLGVNYDNCHLAIEYEEPKDVIARFQANGVKISKLHFSSALKVRPTTQVREALKSFVDTVYFHQVIERDAHGNIKRYKDLDVALDEFAAREARTQKPETGNGLEWRIHFHIPLHSEPTAIYESTSDHIQGVLDILAKNPSLCPHIEMETYTWEVMPDAMKKRNVVDQLVKEYEWTLNEFARRGIRPM